MGDKTYTDITDGQMHMHTVHAMVNCCRIRHILQEPGVIFMPESATRFLT